MASGNVLTTADIAIIQTDSREIKMMNNFTYLGLVISSDGEILKDIGCRLAKALQVFCHLHETINLC